ncbi:Hypothetical_protein [Hexamita inflata]|uniref:Hypothetical_protein n=1 Tax=Hexamita inflata TaxID=28002 RepID=A0AA86UFJ5_9EUKA|nr:Hypothetical protein HINF_LOCUS43815 [Hexamita inflata]
MSQISVEESVIETLQISFYKLAITVGTSILAQSTGQHNIPFVLVPIEQVLYLLASYWQNIVAYLFKAILYVFPSAPALVKSEATFSGMPRFPFSFTPVTITFVNTDRSYRIIC